MGRRLAETFNHVACRLKKQVFFQYQPWDSASAGASTIAYWWPTRFRTGEATTGLRVVGGILPTDYAVATGSPSLVVDVRDTSGSGHGSSVVSQAFYTNARTASATVVPDEVTYFSGILRGLSANTEYQLHNYITEGCRPLFLSVVELDSRHADDTVSAVCDPGPFTAEAPVYDLHFSDLVTANNSLWRHNGAQLATWCVDGDEDTAAAWSATSYTNLIDGSSTSVSASTPGFNLFTQYHNTLSRTTVPVKACFKVSRSSGTGTCDVRFTDGTNSIEVTGLTGAGTQWGTVTGTIPTQAGTKWDLQARVSSGSWIVRAAVLFEYEA